MCIYKYPFLMFFNICSFLNIIYILALMSEHQNTQWFVILNPHAGSQKGKRDKRKVLSLLDAGKFSYIHVESEYQGHTIKLAQNAVREGYRKFVIVGGDGTLNEAVNGIMHQDVVSLKDIVIGVIPVGTGNDWIRTFDIPNDYRKSVKVLKANKIVQQDIGMVSWGSNGEAHSRYFANMAGFGFDAVVAKKVNQLKDKGLSGAVLYLWSLLSGYFSYHANKMSIEVDGQKFSESIFTISVGIGKFNGGGMMQAPDATPDNGEFTLTIIRKLGLRSILKNLRRLYDGTFIKDPHVFTTSGRNIKITAKRELPGEVDGEQLGTSNFSIVIHQEKLNVICGSDKYLKHKLSGR